MPRKPGSSYRWTANLGRDTYIVRKGKYKGAYHVYSSLAAFRQDHPNKEIKEHWSKGHPGDYVLTDCGRIVPVLARTILQSKRRKQRPTIAIRVPHGTAGYYERVDGTSASTLILETMQGKASGRFSMESPTTFKTGKHWTKKKQRFATLLGQGVVPYRAFMMAWGERDIGRAKRTSIALLREEGDHFMAEIKRMYSEIFDNKDFTQDDIAEELVSIAKNKARPKTALDAIALILELRGERVGANLNVNLNGGTPLPTQGAAIPVTSPQNAPPKELAPVKLTKVGQVVEAEVIQQNANPSSSDEEDSSSSHPSQQKTSSAGGSD